MILTAVQLAQGYATYAEDGTVVRHEFTVLERLDDGTVEVATPPVAWFLPPGPAA